MAVTSSFVTDSELDLAAPPDEFFLMVSISISISLSHFHVISAWCTILISFLLPLRSRFASILSFHTPHPALLLLFPPTLERFIHSTRTQLYHIESSS